MKITSTNQQIIKKPELSKADTADNLAGKKKSEQKSDSKVAVAQSAAIKTGTVQLSQKSIALASAAKSDSDDNVTETEKVITSTPQSGSKAEDTNKQIKTDGKTQTNTAQNMDENVLAKLLKMANKRSVIFGSSGISLKQDEQEEAAKESGKKWTSSCRVITLLIIFLLLILMVRANQKGGIKFLPLLYFCIQVIS